MWMLLLLACGVVPYGGTHAVPPVPVPAEVATPSAALLAEIDRLLTGVDEVDRRDRLVELRDLAIGADRMEPSARARVLRYVARAVAIEARSMPSALGEPVMEMAEGQGGVIEALIEEEDLDAPVSPAPGPVPVDAAPGSLPVDAAPGSLPVDAAPGAAPVDAAPGAAPVDAAPVPAPGDSP